MGLVHYYHVWFSTKHRADALSDEIGRDSIESLEEIARRIGVLILESATEFDHVHLLIELPEERALSSAMHRLKGASAREIFEKYPELRLDMQSNSFWQKGYGFRKVPENQIETVRNYIRSQNLRPARHS